MDMLFKKCLIGKYSPFDSCNFETYLPILGPKACKGYSVREIKVVDKAGKEKLTFINERLFQAC